MGDDGGFLRPPGPGPGPRSVLTEAPCVLPVTKNPAQAADPSSPLRPCSRLLPRPVCEHTAASVEGDRGVPADRTDLPVLRETGHACTLVNLRPICRSHGPFEQLSVPGTRLVPGTATSRRTNAPLLEGLHSVGRGGTSSTQERKARSCSVSMREEPGGRKGTALVNRAVCTDVTENVAFQ